MWEQSLLGDASHVVVFRDVDTSMEIDVANRVLFVAFEYADAATIQIDLDELSGEFPKIAESLADTLDTPVDDEVEQSVSIEPVRRPLEDFLEIQSWQRFVVLKRLVLRVDDRPFLFYNPDHAQLSFDVNVVGEGFLRELSDELGDIEGVAVIEAGVLASWESKGSRYELTARTLCRYDSSRQEGSEPDACYQLRHLVSVVVEGDTLRLEWRNEGSRLSRFLNVFGESRPDELTFEQSADQEQVVSSFSDIIGSANVVEQT